MRAAGRVSKLSPAIAKVSLELRTESCRSFCLRVWKPKRKMSNLLSKQQLKKTELSWNSRLNASYVQKHTCEATKQVSSGFFFAATFLVITHTMGKKERKVNVTNVSKRRRPTARVDWKDWPVCCCFAQSWTLLRNEPKHSTWHHINAHTSNATPPPYTSIEPPPSCSIQNKNERASDDGRVGQGVARSGAWNRALWPTLSHQLYTKPLFKCA